MLVSTRDLLREAQKLHYAVGAFNTYNLELTTAILRAAQALGAPVILQLGSGALRYGGMAALVGLNIEAARAASVPVALHLDHGSNLVELEKAVGAGFTSVMIDGSRLSLEENIDLVRRAVQLGQSRGIPVEAELGRLAGSEDEARISEPAGEMTDPRQAAALVESTSVDSLAVCVGNVHGFYSSPPRLDLDRLQAIRERVSVPLVLHGASGLPDDMIRAAIERGVAKFNVNTELRAAFFGALTRSLSEPNSGYDLPRLMGPVISSVEQVVARKIALFGSAHRAGGGQKTD